MMTRRGIAADGEDEFGVLEALQVVQPEEADQHSCRKLVGVLRQRWVRPVLVAGDQKETQTERKGTSFRTEAQPSVSCRARIATRSLVNRPAHSPSVVGACVSHTATITSAPRRGAFRSCSTVSQVVPVDDSEPCLPVPNHGEALLPAALVTLAALVVIGSASGRRIHAERPIWAATRSSPDQAAGLCPDRRRWGHSAPHCPEVDFRSLRQREPATLAMTVGCTPQHCSDVSGRR